MRKLSYLVLVLLLSMAFSPLMMSDNVEAATEEFTSTAGLDGVILSQDATNYTEALWGIGDLFFASNAGNYVFVTNREPPVITRGFLSFDTTPLPDDFIVTSATMNLKHNRTYKTEDFSVRIYNTDYGAALTTADWNNTGDFEGSLFSGYTPAFNTWFSLPVSASNIDVSGRTQYVLKHSLDGTQPTVPTPASETYFWGSNSIYQPYLTINGLASTGAVVTYNFTQQEKTPDGAMLEFFDAHEHINTVDGFETGNFTGWTTFGSPLVTNSYTPYAGTYHAGARIGNSGAGNHTFEKAIDTTGHYNVSISYARRTDDVGGGTTSLILDWYNGTAWNEIENITGANPYAVEVFTLNSTADNNANIIFRFNVTITAGNANNGGWVDDVSITDAGGNHSVQNTTIYPAEIINFNGTYDLYRYEFHTCLNDWIILTINESFIYQSVHPLITVVNEGGGVYNMTDASRELEWYHIWFTLERIGIGTNYSLTIYPVDIQDWNNTHETILYEVYLTNESFAWLEVNDTFEYLSCNPYLNVTDLGGGIYNLTDSIIDFEYFHIWLIREKVGPQTWISIALFHATLGEGILWETFQVVINPGLTYDEPNATRIPNPNYAVDFGQNFTISVMDFFGNQIVNHSFTTNSFSIDILIGVPVYTLQVVNHRQETSLVAIYFNASGDPFTRSVVANDNWDFPIREGSYQFIITYLYWDNATQTETVGAGYSYNLTIDADFNFIISESQINVIKISITGVQIDVNTIVTITNPSLIIVQDNPCLVPTEQVAPADELMLFLDPWYVITADIRISDTDNLTAAATLLAGELDSTLMAGSIIIMADFLTVSAANTTADMIVNDTDTATEVINTSAPAGAEYDILADHYANRAHALTVWVQEGAFSITRHIRFRQSQSFDWRVLQGGHFYTTTVQVNNTQVERYIEPHVFVAFHNSTNPDLDRVEFFDQNNNVWLEKGTGFAVDNSGVSFMFSNLTAGAQRTFTIQYFGKNETLFGEGWIDPNQAPQWYNYNNRAYRYVFGTYTNIGENTFEGVIKFSLDFTEADNMDRGSIVVIDLNSNNELGKHAHWRLTDSAIEIRSNYVGQIDPGATLSIGVLYLRTDETTTSILTDPIVFGMSLPVLMVLFAALMIILGLLARSSDKLKAESKVWINTGIVILAGLIALIMLILAVSG